MTAEARSLPKAQKNSGSNKICFHFTLGSLRLLAEDRDRGDRGLPTSLRQPPRLGISLQAWQGKAEMWFFWN